MTTDPGNPSLSLLSKLGSIIVHFATYASDDGRPVDLSQARDLMEHPEVQAWLEAMADMVLVPKMRKP